MATFTRAAYSPMDGIKNTSTYPTTPADETAARKQLQDNFDQIRDDVNALEAELEAGTAASKLGAKVGGVDGNIQTFIDNVEAAGAGSLPPAGSVTDVMMASDVKIGSLASLTTTVKTSVVNAINSIITLIGSLSGLSTTDKTSVVNAINEVNTKATSPLSTEGDMLYRNATEPTRLAKGTARQTLAMNSSATAPEWVASPQSIMTSTGDLLYASGANTPNRLPIDADATKVLGISGGIPAWVSKLNFYQTSGDTSFSINAGTIYNHDVNLGIAPKLCHVTLYNSSNNRFFSSYWVGQGISSLSFFGIDINTYPRPYDAGFNFDSNPTLNNCRLSSVSINGTNLRVSISNSGGSPTTAYLGWRILAIY